MHSITQILTWSHSFTYTLTLNHSCSQSHIHSYTLIYVNTHMHLTLTHSYMCTLKHTYLHSSTDSLSHPHVFICSLIPSHMLTPYTLMNSFIYVCTHTLTHLYSHTASTLRVWPSHFLPEALYNEAVCQPPSSLKSTRASSYLLRTLHVRADNINPWTLRAFPTLYKNIITTLLLETQANHLLCHLKHTLRFTFAPKLVVMHIFSTWTWWVMRKIQSPQHLSGEQTSMQGWHLSCTWQMSVLILALHMVLPAPPEYRSMSTNPWV